MVHVVSKIVVKNIISSFKSFDEKKIIDDPKSTPLYIIKVFDDVNDIVDTWYDLFCDIVDKHLPLRQHHVKRKQQPKWLTADIIDAFKTRDRLTSLNNHEQNKIWRNKVSKMITTLKKLQYSEIINENVNNPSSVWEHFKEIGASKRNIGTSIFPLKLMIKQLIIPLKFHLISIFFGVCSFENKGTNCAF